MNEVTRSNDSDNTAPTSGPGVGSPESSMPAIEEYKGHPMIVFNPGARFPFSLGLTKARMALQFIPQLQRFVDTNGKSVEV